jgi:uncharacterized protein with ParB-like and HNH nuclease domain
MIQPKSRTIDDIFSDGQNRIVVPNYQRNFDWGKNEIQELMTDLEYAGTQDSNRLFLGTFVFDTSSEGELKVVDGQQRLTTISLVLLAARAVAKKNKQFDLAQEIQKKLTFTDSATGKKVSERVTPSPSISDVFKIICDNDWKGDFPAKIGNKQVKLQTRKIKPVYDYIYEQLKDFDAIRLSAFLRTLYKAYVIEIVIGDELEAFDIFERTNARGLDLNIADLLKNYLFSSVEETDVEEKWSEIVSNSENTLQRMLKYFWVSSHGYVQKKDLYRSLKTYGREIGAENLTDELYRFSRFYKTVRSLDGAKLQDWLAESDFAVIVGNESYQGDLARVFEALKLFQIAQAYPVIYSVFTAYKKAGADTKSTKILLETLSSIEKYHFINNIICDRVGNEVEKVYAVSAKRFADTTDFKATSEEFVNELRTRRAQESEFVPRFEDTAYRSDMIPLIYYIFDRISNTSHKDSQWVALYNPDKSLLKKNFNIEHFLPQNPENGLTDDESSVVDNIGNLLVISRHSNSSFGNLPPAEKMKMLQEPKHSGKLAYLKEFIEEYKGSVKNWNEVLIKQRAHQLAKKSYGEVWHF